MSDVETATAEGPEPVTAATAEAPIPILEDSQGPKIIESDPKTLALEQENAHLKDKLSRSVEMVLQYQNVLDGPPVPAKALYDQACSNDGATLSAWVDMWLGNVKTNNAKYNFEENSAMLDFGKFAYHPAIVAGSGPSLKKNAHYLLKKPKEIPLVSCLHNFGYFEDLGLDVEAYLNLDAGDITIPEMSQGGSKPTEYYWDSTESKTLVTAVTANPKLIEKWKGKIRFFNSIVPNQEYMQKYFALTPFNLTYNVGGNTMGACMYHARAILGCTPVAFIGADFAFDYTRSFHPFKTPYDQQFSGVIACTDVYGNRVFGWQSYINFKAIFEFYAMGSHKGKPQIMVNCTEGGILGAYPNGNIKQIIQMRLEDFLHQYCVHTEMPKTVENKQAISFIY